MMQSNDPWSDLNAPDQADQMSARRVPSTGSTAWGLYWAVDAQRHCLLILHRDSPNPRHQRLPRLRGLSVNVVPTEDQSGERTIIRLTDGEQREVFHRFCIDVVEATRVANSADEAATRFLARTWRWHRLLRTGRDGRLSEDEQKGLIGELRVIEDDLLGVIDARDAVRGWTGPLGSPKDFELGLVGIEAKAGSPQHDEVRISSLHQLDSSGLNRLFLSVVNVATASERPTTAVTITDVATRVRDKITAADASAQVDFEERLAATGFDWEEDYSDWPWAVGDDALFEVTEGFPRITPLMVLTAVDDVRYTISLSGCESFRVPKATLGEAIRRT